MRDVEMDDRLRSGHEFRGVPGAGQIRGLKVRGRDL